MHRDPFSLVALVVVLLVAGGVVLVFVPSQRPTISWTSIRSVLQQQWFWRQAIFFALCVGAGVSMLPWPLLFLDGPVGSGDIKRALDGTLIDAFTNPMVAMLASSLFITIGCVLLMPFCEDRVLWPRSSVPPWPPRGRVWSFERYKTLGRALALLGVVAAVGTFLFHSLMLGWIVTLGLLVCSLANVGRWWLTADDVGVNWCGFRFRWEEVDRWAIHDIPYQGDEGWDVQYDLSVTLAGDRTLVRSAVVPEVWVALFDAHVPGKRRHAAPGTPTKGEVNNRL